MVRGNWALVLVGFFIDVPLWASKPCRDALNLSAVIAEAQEALAMATLRAAELNLALVKDEDRRRGETSKANALLERSHRINAETAERREYMALSQIRDLERKLRELKMRAQDVE